MGASVNLALGTGGVFGHFVSSFPKTVAAGLRIDGKAVVATAEETAAANPVANSSLTSAPSIAEMFRDGLTERLTKDAKDKNLSENVATQLKSSLVATASEISKQFGVESAEKFMNQILYATQEKVSEKELTEAVGSFFKELVFNGGGGADFPQKLEKVLTFMNQGLDLLTEDGAATGPTATGLSYAINVYFGGSKDSKDSKEKEVFEFTGYFDWEAIKEPEEFSPEDSEEIGIAGDMITLKSPDDQYSQNVTFSESAALKTASWLKETLGAYNAAEYLTQNATAATLDTFNVTLAIVAQENGQEALYQFADHLNQNVAPTAKTGDLTFRGWSPGLNYAKSDDEALSERQALGPTLDAKNGLWFGDGEGDQKLREAGHQGVLMNFTYTDPQTGAKAIFPKTADLTALFESYRSQLKVDVLV
ncbi:MAG: hypothetical protein LBS60_07970 [Deltaproteobacteria bacterium]|jgi:hypothetical protein|nr:hypothetical protein [Deltaproteobacteria bacterium]